LRALSIVASALGICYNLLQPIPLWAPAAWGVFFIGCHGYQLQELFRERESITLSEAEQDAYEKAFLPHGFTPRQFLDIMKQAEVKWTTYHKGEFIAKRGTPMSRLHFLLSGEVEMVSKSEDGMDTLRPGKGGWLGEFYDPSQAEDYWDQEHNHPVSYKCVSENCQSLALLRKALHHTLISNPRLEASATKAEIADLWGKLHRSHPEHRRRTYNAMLQIALSDGKLDPNERSLLADFRSRHNITSEEHEEFVLASGWTLKDFDAQHRTNPE